MDREKVIKGLECCMLSYKDGCDECTYLAKGMCQELLGEDAIALLKAQEPISVKHIHAEYPEHLWRKDENGEIDEWAMEYEYHQGPVCERCGDSFCIHCEPDGYETHRKCVIDRYECPTCGYVLWKNQKYCNNCGQAVKWE